MTDAEILRWLDRSQLRAQGHATVSLPDTDTKVFVKLLPLTALESEPGNEHSTANVFELPAYYHYRLGGLGFGVWRELETHRLTNEWVLSGECGRFPLLHGRRVLPIVHRRDDDTMSAELWHNDPAIVRRIASVAAATSSMALFIEHVPQTLGEWLRDGTADVQETEAALLDVLAFTNIRDVLHMDAHFANVLTDGSRLYLGDHGLAISRSFDLDTDELAFFERHENFDRCTAITDLVYALVMRHDAAPDWRQTLRSLLDGSHEAIERVPPPVREYLGRRGPVALAMGEFYRRLLADLTTPYPVADLERLLDDGS